MVNNPIDWMLENGSKVDRIIVHAETCKAKSIAIKLAKKQKKEIGFALRPETPISSIKKYLDRLDMALILSVNPGAYGGEFLPETLNKIKKLRKLKPKFDIEVDGGINLKTIERVYETGANMFVCGSYLQESQNVKDSINLIKSKLVTFK